MKKKQRRLKGNAELIGKQIESLRWIIDTHTKLAEASLMLAGLSNIKKLLKSKHNNKP